MTQVGCGVMKRWEADHPRDLIV